MKVTEAGRYLLRFDATSFSVEGPDGRPNFSGLANAKAPKLYVVSSKGVPVYVGITRQPMRNRLRFGWKATGEHGYHGYAWRRHLREAHLDIWCHEDAPATNASHDIETIEAELVFLIRQISGQWPKYQTEIHFRQSKESHRRAAAGIARKYCLKK